MAHDVLLSQLHHSDTFHTVQNLERLFQSASLFAWQVNLCQVAGDNHLGVHAHTGEEHANLLGGSVLCLVEDDYGIAECASAHKGERSNLDNVLFHHILQLYGRYHVFQRIVERLEVWVNFVFHIARQETEFFAGFYGWSREDDFLDGFLLEGLYGKGDAEVGLAGTGWSYGKYHVVLFVSIYQLLLVFAAALDRSAADAVYQYAFHAVCLGLFSFHDVQDVFIIEHVVFKQVLAHLLNILFHLCHFLLVTEHTNHVVACHDTQLRIQRFNHLQVGIVHTVEHHWIDIFEYNMFLYQNVLIL